MSFTVPSAAKGSHEWRAGVKALGSPAWPLCNLAIMLFMAGPYRDLNELLKDLPDEIEMESVCYPSARALLSRYIDLLTPFESYKPEGPVDIHPGNVPPEVEDSEGNPLDPMEAARAWIKQKVLERELERINSLLCGPCQCILCCIGPEVDARQFFFEIPLSPAEVPLFDIPVRSTKQTRASSPEDEPPLRIHGTPFYLSQPAIYEWQKGWSMILTREARCPNLTQQGSCAIYGDRPLTCRRPQVFPFIVECRNDKNLTNLSFRDTILAVWDCPYVRTLKAEIIKYAHLCEADIIFRENKA